MAEPRLTASTDGLINNDKNLADLVQGANAILRDIIGPVGPPVVARWSRRADPQNRPILRLELSESGQTLRVKFAPEELKNPCERLHKAWGDLLQGSN